MATAELPHKAGHPLVIGTIDGTTWRPETLPDNNFGAFTGTGPLSGVSCASTVDCVAVGRSGMVVSSNGGESWIAEPMPVGISSLTAVSCPTIQVCWAIVSNTSASPAIIRTTDGGSAWSVQAVPAGISALNAIDCVDVSDCLTVGTNTSGQGVIVGTLTPTATSLSVSPSTVDSGNSVNFSATVASPSGTPTGTVTVTTGAMTLCTIILTGGTGSCNSSGSPVGQDVVRAVYSGDNSYGPSSTTAALTVNAPPSCPAGISHFASGEPWAVAAMTASINGQTCTGYWVVTRTGGVTAIGVAPWLGDMSGHALNAAMIGIAATPTGSGYYLLGADGGIFTFGDASFHGSTGSMRLNAPVVAMAVTPNGGGYWLAASDGGIFTFGDAPFYGSMGGQHLNKPVVGMSADSHTGGYWLVASDGGIFTFNTPFYGSMGGQHLNLAAP